MKKKKKRNIETGIKYAMKYLSYLTDENEELKTEDVLRFGEERKSKLTGEEVLKKGVYLLWSMAHEGSEWLMYFENSEEAKEKKKELDEVISSTQDFCFMKEIF